MTPARCTGRAPLVALPRLSTAPAVRGRVVADHPAVPVARRESRIPLPDDGLTITIARHGDVVELRLAGELDADGVPRLDDAVAWLRRDPARTVVVDTRGLRFVAVAGQRALDRAGRDPDGGPDPRVVHVVGPAEARMRHLLARVISRQPTALG